MVIGLVESLFENQFDLRGTRYKVLCTKIWDFWVGLWWLVKAQSTDFISQNPQLQKTRIAVKLIRDEYITNSIGLLV